MKPASLAQYLCPQIARLVVSQIDRKGGRTAVGTLNSVSVLPIAELSLHRCYKRQFKGASAMVMAWNGTPLSGLVRWLLHGPIHCDE